MYVWGNDSHGQLGLSTDKKVSFLKKPKKCVWNLAVKSVSCGVNHVGIVSKEGKVFMIGSNSYGKLGIASSNGSQTPFMVQNPTLIEELLHSNIVQVSCGVEFTLALSNTGIVYAWGQNLSNSLGVPSENGLTEVQIDRPR
jgi:alpha-tubulin suppressor-like RCC1 family protein